MEWAEVLEREKCGGERERPRVSVNVGERYAVYWCGELDSVTEVAPDNLAWFEERMNDPENDTYDFVLVAFHRHSPGSR